MANPENSKNYPSIEQLEATVNDFNTEVDNVLKGDKIPQSKRLELYKEGITKLRKRGFSYEKIANMIRETTKNAGCEFLVQAHAIRRYCYALGFEKKFDRGENKKNKTGEENKS
ncbi:hypothetical protein [Sulfuricurvum sp.]|uniref:hypothetical protein n=1 Tax=Sulfuricurvum sp. TaxID=2025608 RepID=UPI002614C65E|nr:hypothetical protein [Sulfuricurvum sp.]MDD3597918.1 hypothetical protein [Sulfuricurvum sp.]